MHVPSVWLWQHSWLRAWFSSLYSNRNTDFTGIWTGLTHLQQETCSKSPHFWISSPVSILSLAFCLINSPPPCPPSPALTLPGAAGMRVERAQRGAALRKGQAAWWHRVRSRLGRQWKVTALGRAAGRISCKNCPTPSEKWDPLKRSAVRKSWCSWKLLQRAVFVWGGSGVVYHILL